MKPSQNLGNEMLKMMTGFDSSLQQNNDQQEFQSICSRSNRQSMINTIRKDRDQDSRLPVELFKQAKEQQKSTQDRDKMTISIRRDGKGNKNQIVVVLESQDQMDALQIQIDDIREKAQNDNYNWEIFDIKQELGQGTFGQVFACLDKKTGKKYALKFIGYEMESELDSDFKCAVKEIVIMQTLAKSNHQSILQIHDVYPCVKDDNKYLVIVMELCDCNLMELIKVRLEENKSRWTDDELAYILYQLIEALLIMKTHHITHRDIKPQNILYNSIDKNYKVADFGGAKFLIPKKKEQVSKVMNSAHLVKHALSNEPLVTVRGSPAYWAPEIYYYCDLQKDKDGRFYVGKQHLHYDPYSSDVYSIGITLLLMKKLVARVDREQIKVEVENLKQQKNPSFFEQVLVKMLEFNEQLRINFDDLLQMLRKKSDSFKAPNELVYVNCMKTGKDKKNMKPADLMQREINLADAYEKLCMFTHAKIHYQLALKYSRKLTKDNRQADILNSLGTINCDNNELDEAEINYIESAALYKKLHGDKHTSVADAYNNIGIVKRKQGDHQSAIRYYELAYSIKEKVFGENNLGGALILTNIGLAYRKLGNLDQSIKFYKNALQIKKLLCGDKSLILCGTYDNLARVYFIRQQYDLAISCYQITAEIYRRYLSQNWLRLADALFELGLCFQNIRRFQDACKQFEEAYNIRKGLSLFNLIDHNGANLKSTILCLEHSAQCCIEEDKFDIAITQYEQLKHIYNKGLIKCSVDERINSIIDVLKNLGAGYMGIGNFLSSLQNYQEAILQLQKRQIEKKVNEGSRLAKILYNMGLVYRKMGNVEKAKQYYNNAATTIQTSSDQADLILFGDILNNMGVLFGLSDEHQQAKLYFELALEKYQKVFGNDHRLCKEVETNLLEIKKWIKEQIPSSNEQ